MSKKMFILIHNSDIFHALDTGWIVSSLGIGMVGMLGRLVTPPSVLTWNCR